VNIRQAIAADVLELATVEKTQPRAAGWGLAGFEGEIKQRCSFIVCAEQDNKLVGFAAVRFAADVAELVNVAVHSQYIRQGIARQLLQQIDCFLTQRQVRSVTLEVARDNSAAYHLYSSAGFKPLSVRKDFYGPAKDAVLMGKNL